MGEEGKGNFFLFPYLLRLCYTLVEHYAESASI